MNLRKILFSFISFLLIGSTLAQQADSLKKILDTTKDVEARTSVYIRLSNIYQNTNTDTSVYYLNKARSLAREFQLEKYSGKIGVSYADILVMQDSLDKALKEYSNAKPAIIEDGDEEVLAKLYLVTGNIYLTNDNYARALEEYNHGLLLSEQNGYHYLTPHFYNNTGSIYHSIESYKKAYENYSKAAELFKSNADSVNLAVAFANIADVYIKTGQYALAREYLIEAKTLYQNTGNTVRLSEIYVSFADLARKQGQLKEAFHYIVLSEKEMAKDQKLYRGPLAGIVSLQLLNKGIICFELDSLDKAESALMECYHISTEKGFYSNASRAALQLSKLYERKGNVDQALLFFKNYDHYSDKASNNKKLKQLAQNELAYAIEKQKKAQEIVLLEARNQQIRTYWIFITGIISFIFLSILLFLLLRLEKSKRLRLIESKKSIEKDLEYRNKELATGVLFQMKKNELVLETSKKLKKLKLENEANARIVNDIISTLDTDPATDLGEEFDIRFKDVHTGFYKSLGDEYPGLTTNELRLCAFLRLNMNTKDISAITYQSTNSITVARHRLRQKFNLDKEASLAGFLSRF
ncbi:MAG: tetratricopeptide repeat protein [Bacteroidales bacterium]|nr:tetratricopeptide repeat protein [Bacteroidales bacterium]